MQPQIIGMNPSLGTAPLQVNSTDVFDFTGNPGRKLVKLSVTNNTSETVGQLPGGETTGVEIIFRQLYFQDAGSTNLNGGSIENPDKYDPHTEKAIFRIAEAIVAGGTSSKAPVVFSAPQGTVTILFSVIVRTDTLLPGAYPQPQNDCFVTTIAGDGNGGYLDGPAHLAQFGGPSGLCVASNGAILIADIAANNDALRELTPAGIVRAVSTLSYSFSSPCDVAVDEYNSTPTAQIVYVTDNSNEEVVRIVRDPTDNTTTSVTVVAGGGADKDAATGDQLDLSDNEGIACDASGGFWLSDTDSMWNRVYQIRPAPGADPFTATAAEYVVVTIETGINDPDDVTVDAFGNIFVTSGTDNALYRRDADGTLTAIPFGASIGTLTACVVNEAGTICYFKGNSTDRIYRARQTGSGAKTPASWTIEEMTSGGTGYQDGAGSGAKFDFFDTGMALDGSGTLFVTDRNNDRIRRVDRLAEN